MAWQAAAEGEGEGPELWAVEALSAPLVERLQLHFAPGRPTSRPDKPEWLLNTVLQVCTLGATCRWGDSCNVKAVLKGDRDPGVRQEHQLAVCLLFA